MSECCECGDTVGVSGMWCRQCEIGVSRQWVEKEKVLDDIARANGKDPSVFRGELAALNSEYHRRLAADETEQR